MRVLLLITICFTQSLTEEVLKVSAGDSYLEAYRESSSALPKAEKKADKKSDGVYPVYSGGAMQYGQPDMYGPSSQAPAPQYGPPAPQYGPPAPQYGPPAPQYGPSAPQYGPPAPQYGPPAPQYGSPQGPPPSYGSYAEPIPQYGPPIYGPPAQNLQVFYGMPHAMISIWDKLWEKLKWKINLFTFGKILLKLHKKLGLIHGEDEVERSLQTSGVDTLNTLSSFVFDAIENYTNASNNVTPSCNTTYCKARKLVKQLDKRISYKKLVTLYASESR